MKTNFIKVLGKVSVVGLLIGLILAWSATSPSLLPRGEMTQALLGSFWFVVGYFIGFVSEKAIKKFTTKNKIRFLEFSNKKRLIIVFGILVGLFLVVRKGQQKQLELVQSLYLTFPVESALTVYIKILFLILMSFFVVWLIKKYFVFGSKLLSKRLPKILSYSLPLLLLVVALYGGASIYLSGVKSRMMSEQRFVQTYLSPPESKLLSGNKDSMVDWYKMGFQGRRFVASPTPKDEINKFWGSNQAIDPIRVYVGIDNEAEPKTRAETMVKELERTGAFERKAIVLFTPSGSGWINETAVNSVEYVLKGDVASAGVQYASVSSFLQFVLDPGASVDVGTLAFNAVRERLDSIPEDKRPLLYVYGESMGSMGSQASFVNLSDQELSKSIDGAVWVGSPSASALVSRFAEDGAPSNVVFGTSLADFDSQNSKWTDPQIALLYNANDPVVRIKTDIAYKRPVWLDGQKQLGVPEPMGWFPGVTLSQLALELLPAGTFGDNTGHSYKNNIPGTIASVMYDQKLSDKKLIELQRLANTIKPSPRE